jgi:hypothetical protein
MSGARREAERAAAVGVDRAAAEAMRAAARKQVEAISPWGTGYGDVGRRRSGGGRGARFLRRRGCDAAAAAPPIVRSLVKRADALVGP